MCKYKQNPGPIYEWYLYLWQYHLIYKRLTLIAKMEEDLKEGTTNNDIFTHRCVISKLQFSGLVKY